MSSSVGSSEQLQLEAVNQAHKQAVRDGTFAGLSAALVGVIIGSKLFRFNRNTTILCGALTGAVSGYQFTQGFRTTYLARLEAHFHNKNAVQSTWSSETD